MLNRVFAYRKSHFFLVQNLHTHTFGKTAKIRCFGSLLRRLKTHFFLRATGQIIVSNISGKGWKSFYNIFYTWNHTELRFFNLAFGIQRLLSGIFRQSLILSDFWSIDLKTFTPLLLIPTWTQRSRFWCTGDEKCYPKSYFKVMPKLWATWGLLFDARTSIWIW